MKPTITNAFNEETPESSGATPHVRPLNWGLKRGQPQGRPDPRKSLAGSLSAMQADLRDASFGYSLELSPMHAIDALQVFTQLKGHADTVVPRPLNWLVNIEQTSWRDGERDLAIGEIVQRLALPIISAVSPDQLVMDAASLQQLVSLCQPTRLVAIAVEGEIDERDAGAMSKAMDAERSPLLAEVRALAALEVLGDRSLVLHCRDKNLALTLVADNFRHYLSALINAPANRFESPEAWMIERLLDNTGMLTVRPIETQQFSTSIDVGVNTTNERFSRPADRSLIYDIPSNSWHDEA